MSTDVKVIECPRDAWQGLKQQIPTATKVEYLRALIEAGFKHLDAVSFVSPKAVPQMADSEEVLRKIEVAKEIEIIGIVVNEKGVERAIETGKVTTLGFPYSLSPTFLRQNQNQSLKEAIDVLEKIKVAADNADLRTVVYISMAFGNPYGDLWNQDELVEAVRILADMTVDTVSLADTVGVSDVAKIAAIVAPVTKEFDHLEIGLHLHSRREQAAEKILAAYDAGCRRFDSAIGGLGGCPFAQDELVGNIPTEILVDALRQRGIEIALNSPLDPILKSSAMIAGGTKAIM